MSRDAALNEAESSFAEHIYRAWDDALGRKDKICLVKIGIAPPRSLPYAVRRRRAASAISSKERSRSEWS
jgi:hypothetical protein